MQIGMIGGVVVVALLIGFGAGLELRPALVPATSPAAAAGVAQPTEAEATAAVRRYKTWTGLSLANATLKLGDCSAGGIAPGVTCLTQLTIDPTKEGATPQNHPISFARIAGQWEVSAW